jgi:glyoxylase-like metal-dependent hydrolase (beta-lactamase superfamily II)
MNQSITAASTLAGAQQIIDNLWRVGGGSWNGRTTSLSAEFDGNVYLLRTTDATILVDCATLTGLPAVTTNLDQLGVALQEIDELLLTHSHWDHTEATAAVQTAAASHARTHLNSTGEAFLERSDHRLVGYQITPPPHPFEPFRVDHGVNDREEFEVGGARAIAYHLPGHTPDSTLYTITVDGITAGFCGDIVFQPRSSDGPLLGQLCTLWLSNLDHYVESLRRLLDIHLDLLLPGHGDPVRGSEDIESATQQTLEVALALAAEKRLRENLGV